MVVQELAAGSVFPDVTCWPMQGFTGLEFRASFRFFWKEFHRNCLKIGGSLFLDAAQPSSLGCGREIQ